MLDDLIRRRVGEEAQVLAAGGFVVGGEPIFLARGDRTQVDLLTAEMHRGPRRLSRSGRDVFTGHAKHPRVPFGRGVYVRNLDDQMIQRLYGQGHRALSLSSCASAGAVGLPAVTDR